MKAGARQAGAVSVRTIVEFAFIFALAYVVVQVAPVVVLRVKFLNELELLANSPIEESAALVRRKVLGTAEGYGIALISENLHVVRDREARKTTIDVRYQLHFNFWPNVTYVWSVHDRVEALLL